MSRNTVGTYRFRRYRTYLFLEAVGSLGIEHRYCTYLPL